MKSITYEDLRELFHRMCLYAKFDTVYFLELERYGLPYLVRHITASLWWNQAPETEYTKQFRAHVDYLNKHGHWNIILEGLTPVGCG